MTNSLRNVIILLGIMLVGVLGYGLIALGSVTFTTPTQPLNTYKNFTFFSATTTTATSTNTSDGGGYLVTSGAKRVVMYFTHGGVATTSTTGAKFTIQTSPDGLNWNNYNTLVGPDVSQTATSSYTIQAATSTAVVPVDITKSTYYAIRCISTEIAAPAGTDGESTCAASVEF